MDAAIALAGFLGTLGLMALLFYTVRRGLAVEGDASAFGGIPAQRPWDARPLWALILVALIYSGLLRFLRNLTGIALLDGSIGLALGLYICSHPAANAVNMLFFERHVLRRVSEWPVVGWLSLNLLTPLAGWMVIFLALRRIVERTI